ncbi:hypothetical protein RB11436 [Rhodopirellula baltica SH 1]|uniref:Uncharacterized protein n=1 Tax=Rhodopirellula baltica (strain DSM 10527 / NCIMB 13988 / SH1) TaxID=243090 RepID=Q7UEB8_RHOBA|nr:hypothetical protein RB11436 [Rhodopirellula baltica SH 1]
MATPRATKRWSQMARRPAATRFKWVRLPPAFLDRPTDESEYIFAKEPSDSKPSLVDHNTKFNCLLGIHPNYEDPKVSSFRATGSSVSVDESP